MNLCLSQGFDNEKSVTIVDITSDIYDKFGIATYGVIHGVISQTLVAVFVGTSVYLFNVNFDPYRGFTPSFFILVRDALDEELEQSYFVYPIMKYISSSTTLNKILMLNINNEEIVFRAIILSCVIFSLLHLYTPTPIFSQLIYTFFYCLSLTPIKNEHGVMFGVISHIVFNFIGFKLLNMLRSLKST